MAIRQYLAMTAAEMTFSSPLPRHAAWMACHFSPYSTGLTNLPEKLPLESLLILNDRTPIHGHEPERVFMELEQVLHRFHCPGLLIDFQNPPTQEALALTAYLAERLDVPMAAPGEYAGECRAVFLPPVPTDTAPGDYLRNWKDKEIWLEAALEGQDILLTTDGAVYRPNRHQDAAHIHEEARLHCHYSIEDTPQGILFHTWRTREDLQHLLQEAESFGVTQAIGLYQELGETAIGTTE